jgi:CBS domain-containing protein
MAMSTTREMLDVKGDEVWSILASQSVYEAVALMADKEVGALMVVNDQARLMGIISERDYARKVILNNKSSRDTLVADIMMSATNVSLDDLLFKITLRA